MLSCIWRAVSCWEANNCLHVLNYIQRHKECNTFEKFYIFGLDTKASLVHMRTLPNGFPFTKLAWFVVHSVHFHSSSNHNMRPRNAQIMHTCFGQIYTNFHIDIMKLFSSLLQAKCKNWHLHWILNSNYFQPVSSSWTKTSIEHPSIRSDSVAVNSICIIRARLAVFIQLYQRMYTIMNNHWYLQLHRNFYKQCKIAYKWNVCWIQYNTK